MYKSIAIVIALFISVISLNAQNSKMAVVDLNTIATELPETKKVDAELQKLIKVYQDSVQRMNARLEADYNQYMKQKSMMPADQQQKTEQELTQRNLAIQQFYTEKLGQQGELAKKQADLLGPIRDKVVAAIEVVAQEEGYSIVLEKTAMVLYSKDKDDITFKVLDRIKRGL